jgi:hypothetical protein
MDLRDALDDMGFAFLEIERGYALVPLSALNGAPSVTAKKYMPEIASNIGKGKTVDFDAIEAELGLDEGDGADTEEA